MLHILSKKNKHYLFLEILMAKLEQYVSERVADTWGFTLKSVHKKSFIVFKIRAL